MTRKCGHFLRLSPRSFLSRPLRLLRMDGLTLGQHGDELFDPRGPGLRLLGVMGAVKDRVAILRIEGLEEGSGLPVFGERGAQIVGYRGRARCGIRPVPAAISLRAVDLTQA